MKNKSRPLCIAAILSGTLAFFVIAYLAVLPKLAVAQTSTYPMHDFTFDTLGQSLLLTGTTPNPSGDLKETQNGSTVQDWAIKYEWKGGMRAECRPPVLNVTFSSGNPQGKFHGVSTYDGKSTLKYKKVRLIPECDGWNDYSTGGNDIGFSGQLNVNLREYIIFKIFRAFGVPTMDIVGFANVKFVTSDPESSPTNLSETFRASYRVAYYPVLTAMD